MQRTDDFFDIPKELTASKIEVYKEYIGQYVIKVLMGYGECLIADLFCGKGKSGTRNGSPLVLIEQAEKMLSSTELAKRWSKPVVHIVFCDKEKENIEELEHVLSTRKIPENIKIYGPYQKTFDETLEEIEKSFQSNNLPKFFLLDPFTYTTISIDKIKQIMDFPMTEVLLFVPIMHIYRFSKSESSQGTEVERFLNMFTEHGIYKYKDVHEFMSSIKNRLMNHIGLEFVRKILLNAGAKKNGLYFLTKKQMGMMTMNAAVWGKSDTGYGIDIGDLNNAQGQLLFDNLDGTTSFFQEFRKNFKQKLKSAGIMDNMEIIKYCAMEEMKPEHGAKVLKQLEKEGKISVKHMDTKKTRGYYVGKSNWNQKLSEITYIN